MPLQYAVRPKTILLCDYSLGGFRPPEMVKRRPAVVVAGALPGRGKLLSVPLSGTASQATIRYHCRIELQRALPAPFDETIWWAKADMLATVAFDRLDLFRTDRDQFGRRKYLTDLRVSDEHLTAIQNAMRAAFGL